jgi:hypothetical protein
MNRNKGWTFVFVGVVAIVAAAANAQTARDGFSVVVERTGAKWSLECADGCPFKTAGVTVENPAMPMRVDNLGLRTSVSPQPDGIRFGFTLTPQGNGWAAMGTQGTLWTAVSIDCPSSPCRATVTERGVQVGSGRQ